MENKPFTIKKIEIIVESIEAQQAEECIKKLEIHFASLGEGGNAVVYFAEGTSFSNIVFKKIKKNPVINFNTIDEENKIQEKVRELGVRTPITLLSFETTDNEEYLVMEKINGYSVKDIVANPSLLPEKFNFKIFCDSLDQQIAKMHNKGGLKNGIYHRDLHSGNVMINQEGLPVIIDFGTSAEGTGSDYTYEEEVEMFNYQKGKYEFVSGYFKDDLIMADNIKSQLKMFIKA